MKLRIGVLMGSRSIEREVSFNSGRTVCDHLDSSLYEVLPVFLDQKHQLFILPWRFIHRGKISDFEHRLEGEAEKINWDQLRQRVDFVYIAMHGRHGEDGEIQGMLEMLRIPYHGSKVYASALGMNKSVQKRLLAARGISVPDGITLTRKLIKELPASFAEVQQRIADAGLTFPLVVKPENEGSSLGTSIVENAHELAEAIIKAGFVNNNIPQAVLIEHKVEGMEFSCTVLTDPVTLQPFALPATEIVKESGSRLFDYEQKYMPGRAFKQTPARVDAETMLKIQHACIQTMQALEIRNLARIDGFVTPEGTIVIIDPNTFSGFGPSQFVFRQAAELNFSHTKLINHVIKAELALYGKDIMALEQHNSAPTAPKIRVGVLLGGRSNEREISLESGRNICYKLSPQKYQVQPIFVSEDLELYAIDQRLLVRNSTKEIAQGLQPEMQIPWSKLPQVIDFAFLGLHGGEGENGAIQGALQSLGLPYNGPGVLASALCMDKYRTNTFLRQEGFEVPNHMFVTKTEFLANPADILEQLETLGYPQIIKPHDDGCSVFVSKVESAQEAQAALVELFQSKTAALCEELVQGMELTVGVVGNENPLVLPPSYAVASKGVLSIQEKFLPGAGENQTPAPIDERATRFVQKIIGQVYEAVGCEGYSRIDCFYQTPEVSPTGKERLVILEINTLPGMTPATCIFHQAAELGMRPMEFIDRIVELGFESHHARTQPIRRPAATIAL